MNAWVSLGTRSAVGLISQLVSLKIHSLKDETYGVVSLARIASPESRSLLFWLIGFWQ